MPYGIVKFSVPLLVPKARFTHEVRFSSKGYFTFRAAEHFVEKSTYKSKCFFLVPPQGFEPWTP